LAHLGDVAGAGLSEVEGLDYMDFDFVFRNYYLPGRAFGGRRPLWLPLGRSEAGVGGPTVAATAAPYVADEVRPIFCLFAGDPSSTEDRRLLTDFVETQKLCALRLSRRWEAPLGIGGALPSDASKEYRSMLHKTLITLCPGTPRHEETQAVWEALEAGSIPVIRNASAWAILGRHPLPMVQTWDKVWITLKPLMVQETMFVKRAEVQAWWQEKRSRLAATFAKVAGLAPVPP